MSYNVHSCRGADGQVNPARIAEVIARCKPDLAALQEVDVGRARSGGTDQAHMIATHLNMRSHFHPALHLENERYGDAILTSLPSRVIRADALPSIGEPRGALWVAVDIEGIELHVINTHLGLRRRERLQQISTLLGPGWLGSPECRGSPWVLLGDFNTVGLSSAYKRLAACGTDAQAAVAKRPKATFPARFPMLRLDHIFAGPGVKVLEAEVPTSMLTRIASDHLPVSALLEFGTRK